MLEPIFFKPIYKQVVWGGNNIKNFLRRKIEKKNIGESWEISAHSNGISQIINEAFNNENLYELFNDKSKRKEIWQDYGKYLQTCRFCRSCASQ